MERIFHSYKMRYSYLNHELLPLRASKTIRDINIFINLDNFFHRLHSSTTNNEFQMYGNNAAAQMVGNIINLIGHYKHWAIKEHLHPKIFIYYTNSEVFKNNIIIPEYRNYYLSEMKLLNDKYYNINRAILDAQKLLPVITKYLPNIYGINTSYIEPSIIPYYLSQKFPAQLNLLVTRDQYEMQYSYLDNWVLLLPAGDNSKIITRGNLWSYIKEREKITSDYHFSAEAYLIAKTILGDKYRSIPKLVRISWKKMIEYLEKLNVTEDNSRLFEITKNHFEKFIESKKIEDTSFNNNMYCTSVQHQADSLLLADKIILDNQIEDMYDINGLQSLCNSAFRLIPINLPFVLTELPSKLDEPHDKYFWEKRKKG